MKEHTVAVSTQDQQTESNACAVARGSLSHDRWEELIIRAAGTTKSCIY